MRRGENKKQQNLDFRKFFLKIRPMRIYFFSALLLLAGCASEADREAIRQINSMGWENYWQQTIDKRCQSYGFTPQTTEWSECQQREWSDLRAAGARRN